MKLRSIQGLDSTKTLDKSTEYRLIDLKPLENPGPWRPASNACFFHAEILVYMLRLPNLLIVKYGP